MSPLTDISTRRQSLLLTFILLSSGILGVLNIPNSDAASARSNGNESLTVDVLSDYYDRGSNITLSVMATNLDPVTEYTLEYSLCILEGNWNSEAEIMELECEYEFPQMTGSIDIGSGNMFTLTTHSIEDPGCCGTSSSSNLFDNGTMRVDVSITSQNVTINSAFSNVFVLGGGADAAGISSPNVRGLLVGMSYGVHSFFQLEFPILEILTFTTNCSLLNANNESITSSHSTWSGGGDLVDPFFHLEVSVAGDYRPYCTLTRDFDNAVLATQTGANFSVFDANYTGLEAFTAETDEQYYDHNSEVSLYVNLTDLYPGTEYALTYSLCNSQVWYSDEISNYVFECGSEVVYGVSDDASTTTVNESEIIEINGEIIFTPTTSSHSEVITVSIPDCCGDSYEYYPTHGMLTVDSLPNSSLTFDISLDIFGVKLFSELSNVFILGGELLSSTTSNDHNTILIGMSSTAQTTWYLDTDNRFVLAYTIECDLVNSTGAIISTQNQTWSHNGRPNVHITQTPISAGEHHVECSLTRDFDNTLMGTQTGDTFMVIDANYTGNEQHTAVTDAIYYPHNSTIQLSIVATNLYPDTTYTVAYSLCKLATEYQENGLFETFCAGTPWWYWVNVAPEDQDIISGEVDFTPTSSSYTEVISIAIPDCCGDFADNVTWELENASMAFESKLLIQDVRLDGADEESSYFVIGGEVVSAHMLHQPQILLNMNLIIDMKWELDHRNEFILSYVEVCNLIDESTLLVIDSMTSTWNHRPEHVNTQNSIFTPASEGDYRVECSLTRQADSMLMANFSSSTITVLPEMVNQDDATVSAIAQLQPDGWGSVSVFMEALDAGQSYTIEWEVSDVSSGILTLMDSGDFTWVEGTDSVEEHLLEFKALADSSNACIAVDLYAVDALIDSAVNSALISTLCWAQNSISDVDADGVYDKFDECPTTPTSSIVDATGCSDSDNDGWDDSIEIECGSDTQNPTSIPIDFDSDGTCDLLDTDDDGDGFADEIEYLRGTNPYDVTDFPTNQLPVCSIYYTLEVDGLPVDITGDTVVSTLVIGASSVQGLGTGISPIITVPSGSYFIVAVCQDIDNDPITLSINDVSVGPVVGEVSAAAIIMLSADVDESIEATITWSDGTNSATTLVTVNLENTASSSNVPGFTAALGIVALLGAAFVSVKTKNEL